MQGPESGEFAQLPAEAQDFYEVVFGQEMNTDGRHIFVTDIDEIIDKIEQYKEDRLDGKVAIFPKTKLTFDQVAIARDPDGEIKIIIQSDEI